MPCALSRLSEPGEQLTAQVNGKSFDAGRLEFPELPVGVICQRPRRRAILFGQAVCQDYVDAATDRSESRILRIDLARLSQQVESLLIILLELIGVFVLVGAHGT